MLTTLLADCRFHEMLLGIDAELAAKARVHGCLICGGRLHSARYPRKPHGRPVSVRQKLGPEHDLRFSFCCAVDGCRKRRTPPSVRFLGRQLFLAAAMIIALVLRQRPDGHEVECLPAIVPVSAQTISRWRRWWRQSFPATAFWQTARAAFMPPVEPERLPVALLERFRGVRPEAGSQHDDTDRLIALLRFLGPITGGRDRAC